jgi:hypothetical protein
LFGGQVVSNGEYIFVASLVAAVFVLASPLHWWIVDYSKDVGLEAGAQKAKYMFKSGLMQFASLLPRK